MDYKQKYDELIERLRKAKYDDNVCDERFCCVIDGLIRELKESEDDLTWLTKYIEEEAYSLSMDIRDNEDRVKLKNLKRSLAWLEKQGELKSSKWAEGDVVRHGGILALVTNGRKAMKSNCEQITIQYPDEWVKAETKERKYFFDELEKQGTSYTKRDVDNAFVEGMAFAKHELEKQGE